MQAKKYIQYGQKTAHSKICYLFILFGILLVWGHKVTFASEIFHDAGGSEVAMFADDGQIYLRGSLTTGYQSSSLPTGKQWNIRDHSTGNVLAILALQDNLVLPNNGGTMNAGDMRIRGAVSVVTGEISGSGQACYWGGTAIKLAIANSSGNIQIKGTNGQTAEDLVHGNTSFNEIFAASIVSDPFIYHPTDLNVICNRGPHNVGTAPNYWTNNSTLTNWPARPALSSDYRYANSITGSGDMASITWGYDENSKPVMYILGGDGYGLSIMAGEGGYYNQAFNGFEVFDYPNYATQKIEFGFDKHVYPGIVVSKFKGRPGVREDMRLKYTVNNNHYTMNSDSCGKTLSRFIWRAQAEDWSKAGAFSSNEHYFAGCNAHVMDGELNPAGIIYIDNSLYMTLSAYYNFNTDENSLHDRNYMGSGVGKDVWGVFAFKSVAESGHEVGEIWRPLLHDKNTNETQLRHLNMYDCDEIGNSIPGSQAPCKIFSKPTGGDIRMAYPVFIQFGRGYEDYGAAFPSDLPNHRYVYLMSLPKNILKPQNEMYLARVDAPSGSADNIKNASLWEYYAGVKNDGMPYWISDQTKAVAVLYSPGELGPGSVMFHKPSGRYLMASWSNSDKETWDGRPQPEDSAFGDGGSVNEPYAGRHDNKWFLWEAPKPWGPWRKILSDDYHGRQNDVTGLNESIGGSTYPGRTFGFSGYNIALVPAWMDGWNIWAMQVGFEKLIGFEQNEPSYNMAAWGEYAGYTYEFMKINLKPAEPKVDAQRSALCNFQQNTWKRQYNGTVGYCFKVERNLSVTHLGRYNDTGSTCLHDLKLYRVTLNPNNTATAIPTPTPTPLATVQVKMESASTAMDRHGFIYGKLASPVSLTVENYYVVVSTEQSDGDFSYGEFMAKPDPVTAAYYERDLADVRTGGSITMIKAAQCSGTGTQWNLFLNNDDPDRPHPGNALGPVNMLFDTQPSEVATVSNLLSTIEQNWMAGCKFTVATGKNLTVTHLGRYRYSAASPTNIKKHEIRIISATDMVTIAQTVLDMSSGSGMIYGALKTSVRLTPGDYYLVSREFAIDPDEKFYGHATDSASTPLFSNLPSAITNLKAGYFTYDSTNGAISSSWQDKIWANRCYGPLGVKFE